MRCQGNNLDSQGWRVTQNQRSVLHRLAELLEKEENNFVKVSTVHLKQWNQNPDVDDQLMHVWSLTSDPLVQFRWSNEANVANNH